mmetsp:Transcript_34440/g.39831  ORF Transcript_34440/g.39831 Transcript_34440/m.39831 type:complete len:117 (+) Transcript_34440:494-844(+)
MDESDFRMLTAKPAEDEEARRQIEEVKAVCEQLEQRIRKVEGKAIGGGSEGMDEVWRMVSGFEASVKKARRDKSDEELLNQAILKRLDACESFQSQGNSANQPLIDRLINFSKLQV